MVLNIYDTLTEQHEGNLITNHFLEEYQNLLINLKSAFKERNGECRNFSTVSFHVTKMKDFAVKKGGLKCVELLAEYEKNSAIGDYASCKTMEWKILIELNFFKELWISLLS